MSYLTVAEADTMLGYSQAWLALDDDIKKNHLATAALWLNYSYEWPGCIASCPSPVVEVEDTGFPYTFPIVWGAERALIAARAEWPRVGCCGDVLTDDDGCEIEGIPDAVKSAQAMAALTSLTVPLFGQPSASSDGGLTKKLIKAGSVTIEKQWSEPTRGDAGQVVISSIDAILHKIAKRRGVSVSHSVLFM